MFSAAERSRNNVRAGVFITLALILALTVVVVLSGVWSSLFQPRRAYTVLFNVSTGVNDLKPGAEVRIGGIPLGSVTEVRPILDEPATEFREIAVDLEIDERVTLFNDAVIHISGALIGADAWIDIPTVGTVAESEPPDGTLRGAPVSSFLTTLLGPANAGKADEIIENVRQASDGAITFVDFLAAMPDEWESQIVPIFRSLGATSEDIERLASQLRQTHWPQWVAALDQVLQWAPTATEQIDSVFGEGRQMLVDAREVIAENREGVGNVVRNVEDATAWINETLVGKVESLLGQGEGALASARGAIDNLHIEIDGLGPQLAETLANANIASQQLKLATIEIRRSPWKLLYSPTPDELQHEFLYEAARSFAVAAADLKAASETVQRVLDRHGELLANDEAGMERLRRTLFDSLDHYEKAQQRMLDAILADGQ